jgi:hypothetical protein
MPVFNYDSWLEEFELVFAGNQFLEMANSRALFKQIHTGVDCSQILKIKNTSSSTLLQNSVSSGGNSQGLHIFTINDRLFVYVDAADPTVRIGKFRPAGFFFRNTEYTLFINYDVDEANAVNRVRVYLNNTLATSSDSEGTATSTADSTSNMRIGDGVLGGYYGTLKYFVHIPDARDNREDILTYL